MPIAWAKNTPSQGRQATHQGGNVGLGLRRDPRMCEKGTSQKAGKQHNALVLVSNVPLSDGDRLVGGSLQRVGAGSCQTRHSLGMGDGSTPRPAPPFPRCRHPHTRSACLQGTAGAGLRHLPKVSCRAEQSAIGRRRQGGGWEGDQRRPVSVHPHPDAVPPACARCEESTQTRGRYLAQIQLNGAGVEGLGRIPTST